MSKKAPINDLPSPFKKVLPGLGIGKDKLRLVLHFYSEAIVMQNLERNDAAFKMVDARDLANALASELSFGSGLLPGDADSQNSLWWSNTRSGPVTALWYPPGVRRLALQRKVDGPPERYNIPLPGLIFLCRPGNAPWVFAATRRPAGAKDRVYKAPLANVYDTGNTCPGYHRYPAHVADIPDSFFRSFFTRGADLRNRSKKHPGDITELWKELDRDKKKEYPVSDLNYHGTVADLMGMRI